jgi:hypothetical protein
VNIVAEEKRGYGLLRRSRSSVWMHNFVLLNPSIVRVGYDQAGGHEGGYKASHDVRERGRRVEIEAQVAGGNNIRPT